jgi:hypothetical protein
MCGLVSVAYWEFLGDRLHCLLEQLVVSSET